MQNDSQIEINDKFQIVYDNLCDDDHHASYDTISDLQASLERNPWVQLADATGWFDWLRCLYG